MTHKIINKNNMNKIILATLSAILFMGTSVLTSCNKDDDGTSPISKKVTLNDVPFDNKSTEVFARNIAEAILENPEIINEIHTGISSVVSYGLDENLTFFDILNTEESVFFKSNADFENLRNAIDVDVLEEFGFYAENYYGNLNIYWGYHDNWDGSEMPIVCYLDDNHSSNTAKGYSLVNGELVEVEITEEEFDKAVQPIILINYNEINYSKYPDFKNGIRIKDNIIWSKDTIIDGDEVSNTNDYGEWNNPDKIYSSKFIAFESGGTQHDTWICGGSEFMVSSAYINGNGIGSENTFSCNFTRKEIKNYKKKNYVNLYLCPDWREEQEENKLIVFESDGGTNTTLNTTVSYNGFSINIGIPIEANDDQLGIINLNRSVFINNVLSGNNKYSAGDCYVYTDITVIDRI